MESHSLDDIRYNFLIGGDGSVYEGRGFNTIGEHTPHFNNNSLGIAMIGKFAEVEPTEIQVQQLRKLLQFGIAWEYLKSNYELFGYDQLVPSDDLQGTSGPTTPRSGGKTSSESDGNPGAKLFSIIRKFPHWTQNTFYKTLN